MTTGEQDARYPTPQTGEINLRDALPRRRSLPEENPTPEQIEIYRKMSPGRRLEIAEQMYWNARRLKSAWLKSLHPEWTHQQVEAEVSRIFSNARG